MADPKPKRSFDLFANKKRDLSSKMYTIPSRSVTVQAPSKPIMSTVNARPSAPVKLAKNGLPKPSSTVRRSEPSSRPGSRQASSEPRRSSTPRTRISRPKKVSPVATTPMSEESDDSDEELRRRKRARSDKSLEIDTSRTLAHYSSFLSDNDPMSVLDIVHAADIANPNTMLHGHFQYGDCFTSLLGDEDECPVVELQYPTAIMPERYQLVVPQLDKRDFRPLEEIRNNMKMIAEFYLDDNSAQQVYEEGFDSSGLVGQLSRAVKDYQRAGAQTRFIETVDAFNALVNKRRADGTILKNLEAMTSLPSRLVHHIIKDQVYARTVSPKVDIVRQYEGFSDNVYGELKPLFLDKIFKTTGLKSKHVFVDLGSGVGNCVLQAALQIGCESWGCEVMPNPAMLAQAQAKEFPARCKMWGIKPGAVHLIHDDFLSNGEIREVLKRADVVLVNNQAFNPQLNENLKNVFLDLKEGAQIVSLKYFRDPAHKVKETNINDPVNVLRVVEYERFSNMVSWADKDGTWYIHTKDLTELKSVQRRLERGS